MTAADLTLGGYLGLFVSAFLAATIIPLYSEAVIVALSGSGGFDAAMLVAVATVGNTLGSVVNWLLGKFCLHWSDRKWFPFSQRQLDRASNWFRRYGEWSLLLAWTPVIGDPLTFVAGMLRVRILPFLILVGVGKFARYAVLVWLTEAAAG
jgi:membrane protein YqaA with SNARE-associated domain